MPDKTPEQTVQDILTKLVGFDTTSHRSNRECIDWIRDYLASYGVTSEIVADDSGDKACLWATIGASDKPGIVLAGHSDVVPVDGQQWSSDPFTLTERNGNLYGRGSCDMKAFIACSLALVPEWVKNPPPQPVHLAFTHDEETDMVGAARLTDFMRARGIVPQWVWIGEPTNLRIIDSHKGVAAFETTVTGIPGHSGQPDKGINAIEVMGGFMRILDDMATNHRETPYRPSRFDPPYTTFNLGIIEGGTAENIIAEHCRLVWQARAHPGDNLDDDLRRIEGEVTKRLHPRLHAFAPRAGLKTCTCFNIPPLMPTADNPASRLVGQLTGMPETGAVSFATEAGFFQKLGTHVIVCGPGDIDSAHKADEYVPVNQLLGCVDLVRQGVRLASGAQQKIDPIPAVQQLFPQP